MTKFAILRSLGGLLVARLRAERCAAVYDGHLPFGERMRVCQRWEGHHGPHRCTMSIVSSKTIERRRFEWDR